MSSLQRGVKRKTTDTSNSATPNTASTTPSSSARNLFTGNSLLSNTGTTQPVRKKQKTLGGPKSEIKPNKPASDDEDPLFTVDSEDEDDPLQPIPKTNYIVNIKNPPASTTIMKKNTPTTTTPSNGILKKKTITIAPLKGLTTLFFFIQILMTFHFVAKPTLPSSFEQDGWNKLKDSIQAVFNKTESKMSREELYKVVQDLCMHKMDQSLYEKLKGEYENHIKQVIQNLYGQSTDLLSFLSIVTKIWDEFVEEMVCFCVFIEMKPKIVIFFLL